MKKPGARNAAAPAEGTAEVDAFMLKLKHPLKAKRAAPPRVVNAWVEHMDSRR